MKPENDLRLEDAIRTAKREMSELDMHARDGKTDKLLRCLLRTRSAVDAAINRLLELT